MPALTKDMVPGLVATGGSCRVDAEVAAKFAPGDRIIVRNLNPAGHTRLPRYVRGKQGVVEHDHGVFVLPDTSAHGGGQKPQHVYSVKFAAQELWGAEAPSRPSLPRSLGRLPGSRLRRDSPLDRRPMPSHRVPPRHPDMPPIPQDGDGPVFREPWEAQAFAMVLELYDRRHFTWSEWVRHLSAEIASARARGEADIDGTYYRHWLAALEKLVAAKGLTSAEELAVCRDQWAEADHQRGFGEPIVLDHPHSHD